MFTILHFSISNEYMGCGCHIASYTLDTALTILIYIHKRYESCYCLLNLYIDSLVQTETCVCIMLQTNKTQM
jgi:hypothetical protein